MCFDVLAVTDATPVTEAIIGVRFNLKLWVADSLMNDDWLLRSNKHFNKCSSPFDDATVMKTVASYTWDCDFFLPRNVFWIRVFAERIAGWITTWIRHAVLQSLMPIFALLSSLRTTTCIAVMIAETVVAQVQMFDCFLSLIRALIGKIGIQLKTLWFPLHIGQFWLPSAKNVFYDWTPFVDFHLCCCGNDDFGLCSRWSIVKLWIGVSRAVIVLREIVVFTFLNVELEL